MQERRNERGPSKEQLEFYFRTSRAYFDELAKEYERKDPEYYKKYFAPFYAFSFGGTKTSKPKGTGAVLVFAVAAMLLVVGVAVAVFFTVSQQSPDEIIEVKKTEKTIDKKEPVRKTEASDKRAGADTSEAVREKVVPDKTDEPLIDDDEGRSRNLRRKPYRTYR